MYHGPEGIKNIASRVHRMTRILAAGLTELGYSLVDDAYFDTIKVRVPGLAGRITAKARESQINLRYIDADHLGITLDETTKRKNILSLWRVFHTSSDSMLSIERFDDVVTEAIPQELIRRSSFMEHEIFHRYHSETEMTVSYTHLTLPTKA